MENNIVLRKWIEMFNGGEFDNGERNVQIKAGWYDWFCKDTSLKNKTKLMGQIIKQLKDGGKVDLDNMYVWFKNNCPVSYPLYDDFRIASIKDNATQLIVKLDSPLEKYKYTVYGVHDFFDKPIFEANSRQDLVKFLNGSKI